MNFCPECGARLRPGDRFCPDCGRALSGHPEPVGRIPLDEDTLAACMRLQAERRALADRPGSFAASDRISVNEAIALLTPQLDFLERLAAEYPDNSIYANCRNGLSRVVTTLRNGCGLDNTRREILRHLALLWISIGESLNKLDPAKYREEIDLFVNYAEQIDYILSHEIAAASTTEKPQGEHNQTLGNTPDDFDPAVREEIETLIGELHDQKPAFKRERYNPQIDYRKELDELIGLDRVKALIEDHIIDLKIQKKRQAVYPDLKINASFNSIFKGNPGTGKTTVARLVAGIMKQEGLIENGCYVEVDASTLISGWVGFSAKITRLAALESFGGVLFIDEAYALMNAQGSKSKPGDEVIDTLTPLMENNRDKLTIILAGYDKEMEHFLENANTGFPSRFRSVFQFEDYTREEMYEIFLRIAQANHYELMPPARKRLQTILWLIDSRKREIPSFANARTVRLLFEAIRAKASRRMARENNPNLSILTIEDVSLQRQELSAIIGKF